MKGTPTTIRKFKRIFYGLSIGFWGLGVIFGLLLHPSKISIPWSFLLLVMTLIIGTVLWGFGKQLKRLKITVEE